ncbi:calcium calmodulin-dependent kinase [Fusarium longipes]|uniref:Calcium calmodulin-dependent kinase n=1 Tax=Fusarium longipes TaxID=694270 RepID=A0A395SLR6_9HYPO|nr:calcium calmodulin-dependent kinase [Fusarium longipes]
MRSGQLSTAGPVIFTLIPLNSRAKAVVKDKRNKRFCKRPRQRKEPCEIYVTFNPHRRDGIYPSSMGQTGHIKLSNPFTANNQRSFQIHKDTGEVMLIDNSPGQTCYTEYVTQDGEYRDLSDFGAAVLCPASESIKLTFGGTTGSYVWKVKWVMKGPIDMQAWADQVGFHSRIGQDMALRSIPATKRLESVKGEGPPRGPPRERRYFPRDPIELKCGSWLNKGVDALTGHLVAIKVVVDHELGRHRRKGEACKELSTDLEHPYVIEIFQVEIFRDHFYLIMELQDGDVSQLAELAEFKEAKDLFQDGDNIGRPLLHQMLQALDYLASKNIIHRDVKPHNILYRRTGDSLHYQLSDFGISTTAPHPRNGSGTLCFMAPEVQSLSLDLSHTPKIDVWSLCASICWIFDLRIPWHGAFCAKGSIRLVPPEWKATLMAMARTDPEKRASAGLVLAVKFGGVGRVTAVPRK